MTDVLFTETFPDTSGEHWDLESGWAIQETENETVLRGRGHAWARLQRGDDWSGYTLRCRVKLVDGGVHLNYRVSDDGRYFIGLREDELYLRKEAPWGTIHDLAQRETHQERGVWHDVEVLGEDGHLIVTIDGLRKLEVEDPDPLTRGSIAFETLEASGAVIDDVSVVRTADATAARPIVERFEAATPADWRLSGGARINPEERRLELPRGGRAGWIDVSLDDYTLAFQYLPTRGGGTGVVHLQTAGDRGAETGYELEIDKDRVTVVRVSDGDHERLGEATLDLENGTWSEIAVTAVGTQIQVTVDGIERLRIDDAPDLPPGGVLFEGRGEQAVVIGPIKLLPWEEAEFERVERTLRTHRESDPASRPVIGGEVTPELAASVIPLHVQVNDGTKRTRRINPGPLPPNFVHTWILDLNAIDAFRVHVDAGADLHPHDRFNVYAAAGLAEQPPQPLRSFTADATSTEMTVDISAVEAGRGTHRPAHKRVYVQLETAAAEQSRTLTVSGVEVTAGDTDAAEALVVGDEIDYTASTIAETTLADGTTKKIPEFWSELPLYGPSWDRPRTDEGWYQIGQYIADTGQGFFTLAYYNERRGRVRLYLYNYGLTDASVYGVRLSLLGHPHSDDEYDELDGAFFPLDPDPAEWGTVTLPVKQWPAESWICLEVPMLYPMATDLPTVDTSSAPDNWYASLYEDQLRPGVRNVLFQVEVQSYLKGSLQADVVGKAVGEAIQQINNGSGPSASSIAEQIWTAIRTGSEWKGKAEKFYKGANDYYEKHKDEPVGAHMRAAGLASLLAAGSGPWGWAAAAAGALFSVLSDLFEEETSPDPLQLVMELKLKGQIEGDLTIPHQPRRCWFYLPGRFSIAEAAEEGLPLEDPAVLESHLSRYDRPLGLFGYRYNPSELAFPVVELNYLQESTEIQTRRYNSWWWARWQWAGHLFVYPAAATDGDSWGWGTPNIRYTPHDGGFWEAELPALNHLAVKRLERPLPVIRNPYAEIVPMRPVVPREHEQEIRVVDPTGIEQGSGPSLPGKPDVVVSENDTDNWTIYGSRFEREDRRWEIRRYYFEPRWKRHVVPEPDDGTFPWEEALPDVDTSSPDTLGIDDPYQYPEYPRMQVRVFGEMRDPPYPEWQTQWREYYGYDGFMGLLHVVPESNHVPPTIGDFPTEEPRNLRLYNWYDEPYLSGWEGKHETETEEYSLEFDPDVGREVLTYQVPSHGDDPHPLHDVVFYWDVPYFYYARSRQADDGSVPRSREKASFRSPVSFDWTHFEYGMKRNKQVIPYGEDGYHWLPGWSRFGELKSDLLG